LGRQARRHSPETQAAVELGIIFGACLALPMVAIGLTMLLIVAAAHVG
jgi:hypothetical protein